MKKKIFSIILVVIMMLQVTTSVVLGTENKESTEQPKQEISNTYVGDLNTELYQFNKGEANGASYVSGEIVVVEWVDGKSTVPTKTPKMRFVSTDGTVDMEVFVTPTGTNTYYFDRFIEGIDTTKEYKFYVESTDPANVSEYNKVPVYFKGQFNNKTIGTYLDQKMKLQNNCIVFTDNHYVGDLNTELYQFNKGEANGASYVSGEIVVVEWVDGKSTVPTKTPKMRFVSTDGTVDMEVFVTPTGTNTYYFDRFIEGIDTTKEYKFYVESTDPANVSEYNKVPVYFKGQFDNKTIGTYLDTKMKLQNNCIIFTDNRYVGDLNTELYQFNKADANGAAYVSGEIVVVEWVDGKSTVPTKTPKMRFKSTDETVDMEVFVTPTGTNTYYFDRFIEGIDTSKEYRFYVESSDPANISTNRIVPVYFKGDFAGKIIGNYQLEKMIKLEDNLIKFKILDETYPIIMNQNEKETFDLINQQRTQNGVEPLKIDSRVQMLARAKAEDMVANNYFDHYSPTYGWPWDMTNKAKIICYAVGENIAGFRSNQSAVTGWMNSSGHRANILNGDYNYTGIGVVEGSVYGRIYAQIFIQK